MPEQHGSILRIGEILVRRGWLKWRQLEKALDIQRETKEVLGKILVENGFISQYDLSQALAIQYNIPFVDFTRITVPEDVLSLVPKQVAWEHRFIPLVKKDGLVLIAVTDPLDVKPEEAARRCIAECDIRIALTAPSSLDEALRRYYGDGP